MVRFPSASRDSRRPASADSVRSGRRLLRRLVNENLALTRELEQLRTMRPLAHRALSASTSSRRLFEQHLSDELARSAGDPGGRGTLLRIDINDFKLVRREHGSTAAADVLRSVGEIVRCAIRNTDSCCRTGDDEFMVLLPETDQPGARLVMAGLKAAVIRASSRGSVPFSISIGAASWPASGSEAAVLVQEADRAMSAEKRSLRGRDSHRRPSPGDKLVLVK
jgi:diguanylate cyclase (GGDEF)-like protein